MEKLANVSFEGPARVECMRVIEGPFAHAAYGWAYQVAPRDGSASVIVPESRVTVIEQAPRVVNAWDLSASDFDGAPNNSVIVKTGKASNFRVERQAPGIFIVYGRTEFVGGSTVVRGIDGVRRLLATR